VLITAPLTKGIKHIAFSADGKFLVASAMDDDQIVAVFEWAKPPAKSGVVAPLAFGKSTRAKILSLSFNPSANLIVATCVKEVSFITFAGGVIKAQQGTGWGTKGAESVLTQAFVGEALFTGVFSGEIIQWNGRALGKRTKAHTGRVNAMYAQGQNLLSGGEDGMVNIWSVAAAGLTKTQTIDLTTP
jgi:WD40 repeat protein